MKKRLVLSLIGGALLISISCVAFGASFGIEDRALVSASTGVNEFAFAEESTQDSDPIVYLDYETEETEKAESLIKSRDWSGADDELLAKIAMAEAEGESITGKALVICVVLNRVWSDSFPDSIEDVIYQKNQFSPVGGKRWELTPSKECYEAIEMVRMGWDESRGALYFESSKNEDTWHSRNLEYLFEVGNHKFYK